MAARLVTRLEKRSTLAPVILLGMAVYCLPTLAFLGVHAPAAGFAIQVVRGAGTLVVDVLAVTALQRALPGDVLARVFGVFGSLLNACVLVGALLMPVLIDAAGLDASLWAAGAGVPVLCLLGWPALRAMDRRAAARRVQLQPLIAALRGCDLFAASSEGAVDQLAGAASEIDAASGAVVVRQGEDADAFYVVLAGSLLVTSRGESEGADSAIRDLGPGDYFGEIGLLEHIPRTATVTTAEPTRLLRVDGAAFVEALTESAPSAALLDGASVRLARTHPSLRLTAAALQ